MSSHDMSGTGGLPGSPELPGSIPLEEPSRELKRLRRKALIIRALVIWFSIFAVVMLIMVFVRSRVNRNPEEITRRVANLLELDLPAGFYPYSMNNFMGANLLVYWNQDHLNEEGGTTSLFGIYYEKEWRAMTVAAVAERVLEDMEVKLDRNEFHAESRSIESVVSEPADGTSAEGENPESAVYRFSGLSRMGANFLPATACYRFVLGPEGPIQLHTLGLESNFPAEDQVRLLASVVPKPGATQNNP